MTKSITPLSIDEEIKKKAKEAGINMSAIAEEALKDKLDLKEALIDNKIMKCEFCGREQEKAYVDRSRFKEKYVPGLTWLWPDEKWICSSCLYSRSIHPKSTCKKEKASHETVSKFNLYNGGKSESN